MHTLVYVQLVHSYVFYYNHLSFCQLTAKNIQCMRTLLNLAHCHGAVLGTSWQLVLATLQVLHPPATTRAHICTHNKHSKKNSRLLDTCIHMLTLLMRTILNVPYHAKFILRMSSNSNWCLYHVQPVFTN